MDYLDRAVHNIKKIGPKDDVKMIAKSIRSLVGYQYYSLCDEK